MKSASVQALLLLILCIVLYGSPSSADDRFRIAGNFAAQMRWGEAMAVYLEILKDAPESAEAHYQLGTVHEKVGSEDEAVASYRQAFHFDPGHAGAMQALEGHYVKLGLASRRAKQPGDAGRAFRQALRINPSSAIAHFELAQQLELDGDATGAMNEYRHAIRLLPDMSVARARLGTLYAKQGQPSEAAEQFEYVVRLNPRDPAGHEQLGFAYSELGRRDEAIESLRHAMRYYLMLGQRTKAKPAYDLQKRLTEEQNRIQGP